MASQIWGTRKTYQTHRFTQNEDQRLLSNGHRAGDEKECEGDVEEGERGYDCRAGNDPHVENMLLRCRDGWKGGMVWKE